MRLPVIDQHVAAMAELPQHHCDTPGHLLLAQTIFEFLGILTGDSTLTTRKLL
jgi:PIN domain nuclease of toxin-antitoxin system